MRRVAVILFLILVGGVFLPACSEPAPTEDGVNAPVTESPLVGYFAVSDTVGAPGYTARVDAACSVDDGSASIEAFLISGLPPGNTLSIQPPPPTSRIDTTLSFDIHRPYTFSLFCRDSRGHTYQSAYDLIGFWPSFDLFNLPLFISPEPGTANTYEFENVFIDATIVHASSDPKGWVTWEYWQERGGGRITITPPASFRGDFTIRFHAYNGFGAKIARWRLTIPPG